FLVYGRHSLPTKPRRTFPRVSEGARRNDAAHLCEILPGQGPVRTRPFFRSFLRLPQSLFSKTSTRMNYLEEQKEWDTVVAREIGADARLLSVSTYSSDCRVYQLSNVVIKIRRVTPASCRHRLTWFEDEFLLLKQLAPIAGVPAPRSYRRTGDWELLEMTLLAPLQGHDPTFG